MSQSRRLNVYDRRTKMTSTYHSRYCPSCGALVGRGDRFCSACGTSISRTFPDEPPIVPDDPTFCNYYCEECGQWVYSWNHRCRPPLSPYMGFTEHWYCRGCGRMVMDGHCCPGRQWQDPYLVSPIRDPWPIDPQPGTFDLRPIVKSSWCNQR